MTRTSTTAPFSIAEQSIHFLTRPHTTSPDGPMEGPKAWYAADLATRPDRWYVPLDPAVATEFVDHVSGWGDRPLAAITADELETPALAVQVADIRHRLRDGLGFCVLRDVPVEQWAPATTRLFLWAVARLLGTPGVQNPKGDVIGEVRDTAADERDPLARNYATNKEFRFHCDAADVVGLLCIRPAVSGGRSKVASSLTVYNELRATRPDLAARLFEPVVLDARNEQGPGMPPYAWITPLAFDGETLRTFYISDYFRSAERFSDVEIDTLACELFDVYETIAGRDDVCLRFDLRPGDLEVLDNHSMLHARDPFVDGAPDAARLLLRILVSQERQQ